MNYAVEWAGEAIDQLAALWLAANDRGELTALVAGIDHALAVDPHGEGESRGQGESRVAFFGPLTVRFYVAESIRTAVVTSVARPRR